ncbi:hypothetical protein D3C87_1489210 [compost metagenome]
MADRTGRGIDKGLVELHGGDEHLVAAALAHLVQPRCRLVKVLMSLIEEGAIDKARTDFLAANRHGGHDTR